MKIHTLLSAGSLATAGLFLGHITHLEAGEVGPMAAYMPPAPVSECDACNDPGWYGGVSLLYLQPYGEDGGEGNTGDRVGPREIDGDWDFGARGTLGFERPDGLFLELNGLWYESDYDIVGRQSDSDTVYDNKLSTWYIEGLIGDNLHCGEACLDFAFGLRYASLKTERSGTYSMISRIVAPPGNGTHTVSSEAEFEGIGPVVRIDGTRRLTERMSLYAGASQAILFGDTSYQSVYDGSPVGQNKPDDVAYVTELEGGLLFDLNMGAVQGAHVRLGLEAQYWTFGDYDLGLFGGVLGVGFNF